MQYNFALNWYIERPPQINPCERDHDVSDLSPKDIAVAQYIYGKPIVVALGDSSPTAPTAPSPSAPPNTHGNRPDGWASALTSSDLKTHRETLQNEKNILSLNAAASISLSSKVGKAINKQTLSKHNCINILGKKLCNVVPVPQLNEVMSASAERNKKVSESFNALTNALDHLNAVAGVQ